VAQPEYRKIPKAVRPEDFCGAKFGARYGLKNTPANPDDSRPHEFEARPNSDGTQFIWVIKGAGDTVPDEPVFEAPDPPVMEGILEKRKAGKKLTAADKDKLLDHLLGL